MALGISYAPRPPHLTPPRPPPLFPPLALSLSLEHGGAPALQLGTARGPRAVAIPGHSVARPAHGCGLQRGCLPSTL